MPDKLSSKQPNQEKSCSLVVLITVVSTLVACAASCIYIFTFFTGIENIGRFFSLSPQATPDCSVTTKVGTWPTEGNILIGAQDGWVQADLYSPSPQLKAGYDMVAVIFKPGLKFTVVGVAGTAWKYDRDKWTAEGVQDCTTKHIDDVLRILHKSYIQISVEELCNITQCY